MSVRRPTRAALVAIACAVAAVAPAAAPHAARAQSAAATLPGFVPPLARTISVSGSAEIQVVPDRAEIVLGVETKSDTLLAATRANDDRVRRVIAFLRDSGVPADRIQTDYVSIVPVYHENDSQRIDYYQVQKSIVATLADLSRFDAVLGGAIERGITHVLDVQFRTSQLRSHRDRARERATQAAREKAERLAAALGARIGVVQSLSENTWGGWYGGGGGGWGGFGRGGVAPMPYPQNTALDAAGGGGTDVGDASAPGRIKVTARVDATFTLE